MKPSLNYFSKIKLYLFNKSYRNILLSNMLFWVLLKIASIFRINENPENKSTSFFRKIFFKKLYLHAYQASFSQLNIIEAYKYRMLSLSFILRHGSMTQQKAALNYLDIIKNFDFIDSLNLSKNLKDIILNTSDHQKKTTIDNFNPISISANQIALIGPKYNFHDLKDKTYHYIIATKPPPSSILESSNAKFIIFPGPIWSRVNKAKIEKYLKNFKNIEFFYFWNFQNKSFMKFMDDNYHFPFGAWLMNLQRLLVFTKFSFPNSKICVDGFDFFLTKETWEGWYKKNLITSATSNPLWSMLRHDYLLSFIFSKEFFLKHGQFHGPTVDITRQEILKIVDILISTHEGNKF